MIGMETTHCPRGILSGGVLNGFPLCMVRGENVPCRFCRGPDGDGHVFLSPLVAIWDSRLAWVSSLAWVAAGFVR